MIWVIYCVSSKANYYSLRSQHEKAALYFQRALKLNPRCLGVWTLMGHEYMEMKNTSAAIQAYRSAWKWNQHPFFKELLWSSQSFFFSPISDMPPRWTSVTTVPGMAGVKHEILRMPFYCLYYYQKAHQLRYVWGEKKFFQKQYCKSFFENVCCVL